jgi:acetyl-CoA carboxylase biotin carboxyl carrier protein
VNLKEVKDLIRLISEKGFTEFEIERKGFRMRIIRSMDAQVTTPALASVPAQAVTTHPELHLPPAPASALQAEEPPEEETLHTIKSPLVGTFYRSPSPTSDPFVKVGDRVESDTVVCIVEAMKLMNNIQAEVTGTVVNIYVENGQPVEYGQPLFGIRL